MKRNVNGNFSEIFSLTGAAFNYSSYQHPRRDLGVSLVRPDAGLICVVALLNFTSMCLTVQKYIFLKTMGQKLFFSLNEYRFIFFKQKLLKLFSNFTVIAQPWYFILAAKFTNAFHVLDKPVLFNNRNL